MPDDEYGEYTQARPRRPPRDFAYWEPFLSDTDLDKTSLNQRRALAPVLDDWVRRLGRAAANKRRLAFIATGVAIGQLFIVALGAFLGVEASHASTPPTVIEYCTSVSCSPQSPTPAPTGVVP